MTDDDRVLSEVDDPVPSEVYDIVAKVLIRAGCGDAEIYRVFSAVQSAWPPIKEIACSVNENHPTILS